MTSFKRTRLFLAIGAALTSLSIIQLLFAAPVQVLPPDTVQVMMYQLEPDGRIYIRNNVRFTCATPDNRNRWGCTAFYRSDDPLATPRATVVPYPYGNTPAPQVSFETDYLKNVVPQEMAGGSPQIALRAQAVAARSYAMRQISRDEMCGPRVRGGVT